MVTGPFNWFNAALSSFADLIFDVFSIALRVAAARYKMVGIGGSD